MCFPLSGHNTELHHLKRINIGSDFITTLSITLFINFKTNCSYLYLVDVDFKTHCDYCIESPWLKFKVNFLFSSFVKMIHENETLELLPTNF